MKDYTIKSLNNGISIVSYKNEYLHHLNIMFCFNAGIIYETEKTNGISHLLEHLYFRRMYDLTQEELYFSLNKIGAVFHASTYYTHIKYDITVSKDYFKEVVDICLKLFEKFEWYRQEIDKEKEIVLREIDNKYISDFDYFIKHSYFCETKYEMPILGTYESVRSISVQEVNDMKEKIFNPNNCRCFISGNFSDNDYDYLIDKLDALKENKINLLEKSDKILPLQFGQRGKDSDLIYSIKHDLSDISVIFDVDDSIDVDALHLLTAILGGGDGTRLFSILRDVNGLVYDIDCRVICWYKDFKQLIIALTVENRKIKKCLKLIFDEIASLKREITQNDFESNIKFFSENILWGLDEPRKLNKKISENEFMLNDTDSIYMKKDKYQKMKMKDILECAQKVFVPENLTIAVSNNKKICKERELLRLLDCIRKEISL